MFGAIAGMEKVALKVLFRRANQQCLDTVQKTKNSQMPQAF